MQHVTLKATKREVSTKQALKRLRKSGEVPCVLYGHNTENVIFSVHQKDLRVITHTPNSYIIDMDFDGKIQNCIFHDIQFHPVNDEILHMDFLAVSPAKPVVIDIPIVVEGSAEGVKVGGKLMVSMRKLRVSAMMDKLPGHVTVDVTSLGIGKVITAGDINIDGVQIVTPKSSVVCSVNVTRAVALAEDTVETPAADAAADATAATDAKPAEEPAKK